MSLSLLVPLDGSHLSERAIPYAAALAGSAGRVVLVRAVDDLVLPGLDPQSGLRLGMRHAARYLASFVDALRAEGTNAEPQVAPGPAADVIARAARDLPADLIVMSTHGRGLIGRWLFGSVADEVVRTAGAPILLLPRHLDAPARLEHPRVLVPLDGSEVAATVLESAVGLAHAIDADVVLVRAVPMPMTVAATEGEVGRMLVGEDVGAALADARAYLNAVAAQIRPRVAVAEVRADVGDPAAAIRTAARECGATLVAMATHARAGVARAALGSVTERVLRDAEVPLLVVRPVGVHAVGAAPRWQQAEPPPPPITLAVGSIDMGIVASALDMMLGCLSAQDVQRDRAVALLDRIEGAGRSSNPGDHRVVLDLVEQSLVVYGLELALSPFDPAGDGTRRAQELLDRVRAATRTTEHERRPLALVE